MENVRCMSGAGVSGVGKNQTFHVVKASQPTQLRLKCRIIVQHMYHLNAGWIRKFFDICQVGEVFCCWCWQVNDHAMWNGELPQKKSSSRLHRLYKSVERLAKADGEWQWVGDDITLLGDICLATSDKLRVISCLNVTYQCLLSSTCKELIRRTIVNDHAMWNGELPQKKSSSRLQLSSRSQLSLRSSLTSQSSSQSQLS